MIKFKGNECITLWRDSEEGEDELLSRVRLRPPKKCACSGDKMYICNLPGNSIYTLFIIISSALHYLYYHYHYHYYYKYKYYYSFTCLFAFGLFHLYVRANAVSESRKKNTFRPVSTFTFHEHLQGDWRPVVMIM
jgi:hypothetical protein